MRQRAAVSGAIVTVALHGALAGAVVRLDPSRFRRPAASRTIEMEVVSHPPPSPPTPVASPPAPLLVLTARPRARRVVVRAPAAPPAEPLPPTAAPPPASEEPKPNTAPAAPVFGARPEAVVAGDSPVALPIGNTLMTGDRSARSSAETPKPYRAPAVGTGDDPNAFSPAAAASIADWAQPLNEVRTEYPPEARRLGLVGEVLFKLDVDKQGKVRSVRVVSKAGHGFDEAAMNAIRQTRFRPCKLAGGQPVDCQLPWRYKFRQE